MKKIFSFCNQKGGVGKTTSVVNVATALSIKGYKTLIVDMDAQANATSGVGEDKGKNEFTSYQLIVEKKNPMQLIRKTSIDKLDLIGSNSDLAGADIELITSERREFVLKSQLHDTLDEYDYIFIDCPPSLGLTTINCLVASDYILIPLQCEYYALEGLSQLIHTYHLVKQNLNPSMDIGGVILTMADFRTNLTQQVIEEVRGFFKEKVFQTIIPRSVKLSEAPSFGKPAVIYDPLSRGSRAYQELTGEFEQRFSVKVNAKTPETETRVSEAEIIRDNHEEVQEKQNITESMNS